MAIEEPKLGLALSGGGHRAAFFHIGVLAKLAELGLLRRIEVISTVSGGSIVGALYYLHVKNLLEDKTAQHPSRFRLRGIDLAQQQLHRLKAKTEPYRVNLHAVALNVELQYGLASRRPPPRTKDIGAL
jgi:predicted acylesterase/phospholipase RssA